MAAALVLWLVLTASARAQGGGEPSAYDEALRAAMAAHKAGDWLEARARFQQANALSSNARTLRGMGASAFEAGLYALAIRDLEAALVHPQRALPPELRAAVQALLDEARQAVGAYRFRLQPSVAVLSVDGGEPVRAASGEVLLDRGSHHLEVTAPGHVIYGTDLTVSGGEHEDLHVALASLSPAAAQPLPVSSQGTLAARLAVTPEALSEPKGPRRDALTRPGASSLVRPAAIATTALGGAVLVTTAVLKVMANARVQTIAEHCRSMPGDSCSESEFARERARAGTRRFEHAITATVILGSTSLAAAAVFWGFDLRARRRAPARALAPFRVHF